MTQSRRLRALLLSSAAILGHSVDAQVSISVVNLIPRAQSREELQNAEPTLALNPANANLLAAAAHQVGAGFCAPDLSGIFVSTDGGVKWVHRCVVPRGIAFNADYSMRFSLDGTLLYLANLRDVGIVDESDYQLQVTSKMASTVLELRDLNPFVQLTGLALGPAIDQPQLRAWEKPSTTGAAASTTGLVIGTTDFVSVCPGNPSAASVEGAVPMFSAGVWTKVCVSTRPNVGDPFGTRVALNKDGTAYAAYVSLDFIPEYCWVLWSAMCFHGNVVVVRSNLALGASMPSLDALSESPVADTYRCESGGMAGPGMRVASCRTFPMDRSGNWEFGYERRQISALSIAVDPNNSNRVFVAWGDSLPDGSRQTLHVRMSTDGAATWSEDLIVVPNATNPTLAIDKAGRLGFAYQGVVLKARDGRHWQTRFLFTTNNFNSYTDYLLADTPGYDPDDDIQPYIGDYMDLIAHGDTFYGVFSAYNQPNKGNFPFGVTYTRRVDFTNQLLCPCSGNASVSPSIDPFFYKITIP